jgi:hypothetical protein
MQRRLIVPDLAVKLVSLETKRRFGQFESFIRADLDSCSQWNLTLKQNEHT